MPVAGRLQEEVGGAEGKGDHMTPPPPPVTAFPAVAGGGRERIQIQVNLPILRF